MKVKLIQEPNPKLSAKTQVLINRGIDAKDINTYINSTDEVINSFETLGIDNLKNGVTMIMKAIAKNYDTLIIVDADCDGFTSSALLINYLYERYPAYVRNHVHFYIHKGKAHGLEDCIDTALDYKLVICPDSSSNDYELHKRLYDNEIDVLVLDHHEAKEISPYACIINNQLSEYPNKELSGVGVVWQFCRYFDSLDNSNFADNFLDLVAIGNMADMMSLTSIETKHLIHKGLRIENIKNPFINALIEKNEYSLSKQDYKPSYDNRLLITPMGAAFFVSPFINAMVRSGSVTQNMLMFKSMLTFFGFTEVPSTKRGHSQGETEKLVDQAIRTSINVKKKQTDAEKRGLEYLSQYVTKEKLNEHKFIMIQLEPGQVSKNIAGLIANKFMAKYQRPVCILTKVENESGISYQGSARGYGSNTTFKDMCAASGAIYAEGHQGAFGLGIAEDNINYFIDKIDDYLKDVVGDITYNVDYIWDANNIDGDKILEIADMNDYWGKNIDRALVCINNINVSSKNFKEMASKTLKISLNSLDIIKFSGTEEDIETFNGDEITIRAICKCASNEWNGIHPQLIMVDYEIVEQEIKQNKNEIDSWDF